MQVGGQVVVQGVPWFEKCFLFVLCGVFGGSVMIDVLRSSEDLLHFFLFTLFTWIAGWLALRVNSFANFLSFFSPPS